MLCGLNAWLTHEVTIARTFVPVLLHVSADTERKITSVKRLAIPFITLAKGRVFSTSLGNTRPHRWPLVLLSLAPPTAPQPGITAAVKFF
ncbi:hypothetical protein BN2476_190004 [Paraburkholderia piptadeniae]|uniref:Uncharacterized protein n=1 Tax=Paraburkholderia piptadeniae TaxID=1701573 RepID=A0A1N7RUH1_9BURK|nr:hypothetical protein BN2476_190004 [Paraburkholderia piptadeniae]